MDIRCIVRSLHTYIVRPLSALLSFSIMLTKSTSVTEGPPKYSASWRIVYNGIKIFPFAHILFFQFPGKTRYTNYPKFYLRELPHRTFLYNQNIFKYPLNSTVSKNQSSLFLKKTIRNPEEKGKLRVRVHRENSSSYMLTKSR